MIFKMPIKSNNKATNVRANFINTTKTQRTLKNTENYKQSLKKTAQLTTKRNRPQHCCTQKFLCCNFQLYAQHIYNRHAHDSGQIPFSDAICHLSAFAQNSLIRRAAATPCTSSIEKVAAIYICFCCCCRYVCTMQSTVKCAAVWFLPRSFSIHSKSHSTLQRLVVRISCCYNNNNMYNNKR